MVIDKLADVSAPWKNRLLGDSINKSSTMGIKALTEHVCFSFPVSVRVYFNSTLIHARYYSLVSFSSL